MRATFRDAALAIALVAPSSYGQTIIGTFDCGQWVKSHTPVQNAWLMGYLSGINFANARINYDPLGAVTSADQVIVWMDNYCHKNPLSDLYRAAFVLYMELEQKAGGPPK